MDYAAAFTKIELLADVAPDPFSEFRRLVDQLWARTPEGEEHAFHAALEEWLDRHEPAAADLLEQHPELLEDDHPEGIQRVADGFKDQSRPIVRQLRELASHRRAQMQAPRAPAVRVAPLTGSARTTPRPRGRRQRRIARATSSADSGSSGEPGEPELARFRRAFRRARGLAECPCCNNIAHLRPRCRLCRGLGFVARGLRNRWKRGWRP